jgi:hypothetical protein
MMTPELEPWFTYVIIIVIIIIVQGRPRHKKFHEFISYTHLLMYDFDLHLRERQKGCKRK